MTAFQDRQLTYRLIASLKANPNNARMHSKAQLRKIASSIRAFGFNNPVLIDRQGMILAGHGRVEAAKLLGMTEVPTIVLEDLTPDQIRAYVIADNRIALDGGWDKEILSIELQNLMLNTDIEVGLTGFEVGEIDLIIGDEADPNDDLPTAAGEVVSRTGDLWQLGKHRVLCADAREDASFDALMRGRKAAAVFTDPPYNVIIDGNVSGKGKVKHGNFAMATGEMSQAEFTAFLEDNLGRQARHSTPGSIQFVCMDFRHMNEVLTAGGRVYDTLLNLCVWVKNIPGQGSFYRSRHELVFVFRNGKTMHRNNIQLGKFGRNRTNVWEYPAVRALAQQQGDEGNLLALHPTVKPVAMVADAILDCSARGDLVLDGFLGSGSTLIAAERVGRVCYGIEIEPRYVDTAIRRWQRLTGESAVNAATGRGFNEAEAEVNHV
jgi:DNA modification methylase